MGVIMMTGLYKDLYYAGDRAKALWLLLVVAVVYLPFLNNPLVFDDISFFRYPITTYADAHFDLAFRWFSYSTLGVTWVFAGEGPFVFRVQNLLLHGVNALLLLLVLRLWINLFISDPSGQRLAKWAAWLGALVFACHPLAVYGAGYVVQRSILMATLFTLLMHLAYFRGLLDGERPYLGLAVAAYFLAVFSKEHSLLAPLILLPLTWRLKDKVRISLHALGLAWLGIAAIALLVVLRAKGVLGHAYEKDAADLLGQQMAPVESSMQHLLSVLTQAGLFFKYLLLMLIPNPAWMAIDMREPFLLNWQEWRSWIGIAAYFAYGAVALFCLSKSGRLALFGLALLYPWCMFPVEFSSIRLQEIFVLYRTYLWLPGMMLIWVLLVSWLPERRIGWVALVVGALLIPLSWNRLWTFADNYRLWDDAVRLLQDDSRPGAQRVYYGRAFAAAEKKNWGAAIADYEKSLSIYPQNLQVHLALARARLNAGHIGESLAEFSRILERNPENAEAYYGKAITMKKMGDDAGAMRAMQQSCDLGNGMACSMITIAEKRKADLHLP